MIALFEGTTQGETQMFTRLVTIVLALVFIFFPLWGGVLVFGWVFFRVEYPTTRMLDQVEVSIAAENARATSVLPAELTTGRHQHFTMREHRAAGREVYARHSKAMSAAARREVAEMTDAERTATQRKLSLERVFLLFSVWSVAAIVTPPFMNSVFHWFAEQIVQARH